jgi:hypothetical protein
MNFQENLAHWQANMIGTKEVLINFKLALNVPLLKAG